MERSFTANCQGKDGNSWVVYFMCATREDAENIVEQLQLQTDDAGVCEMIEVVGAH